MIEEDQRATIHLSSGKDVGLRKIIGAEESRRGGVARWKVGHEA
jgi:hypothetical protein